MTWSTPTPVNAGRETGALVECPVCTGPVSKAAPACPRCGHPVNPTKSGATMVLVFGVLSLVLFFYGYVFGPLAWIFGNRELREIDAGLRLASGRGKARTGRILGIIGTCLGAGMILTMLVALSSNSYWGG